MQVINRLYKIKFMQHIHSYLTKIQSKIFRHSHLGQLYPDKHEKLKINKK